MSTAILAPGSRGRRLSKRLLQVVITLLGLLLLTFTIGRVMYSPGRLASSIINTWSVGAPMPSVGSTFCTGIGSCLCTILPTSSSLPSCTLYSQRQALVQVPWFGSRLLI